jgi:hypothetical protein
MSAHHTRAPDSNLTVPERWTRARLVQPSSTGFIHIGASSGPWRLPLPLPRARRREILASMRETAAELRRDPRVVRADVFRGALRPPGRRRNAARDDAPDADFDAVLLVETTSVATATEVSTATALTRLQRHLERTASRTLAFVGANARRIGPVDHERQGVFLFNYFSADSVETNLYAWQYTAGWFQDRTGLDNSTVLQPVDPSRVPYRLVNHCRWDRWRDILPSLLLRPSFRGFVLRVFEENRVAPRPILYRLHGSR